ncbi:MAG: SxtJ family membrane protein [Elusimicrobiota bacterium]
MNWNPNDKKIRRFGLSLAASSAALGLLSRITNHSKSPWVIGAGIICGALSATSSRAGLWIYRLVLGTAAILAAGFALIILTVFYYCALTPLALILRLMGRDELRLEEPDAESFWIPLPAPNKKNQCERLF